MNPLEWIGIAIVLATIGLIGWPLGAYLANLFTAESVGRVEGALYSLAGVDPKQTHTWREYATAFALFNVLGVLATFTVIQLQGFLPLNPQGYGATTWHSALNTSISFVTNTNWQGYAGEASMSYLTQMLALCVQNFLSAASGIAVAVALCRGFAAREQPGIGNFWVDVTRAVLYLLLPGSFVIALLLCSQGVVQTFAPYATAHPLAGGEQIVALGPAASQIAIKMLGTNGGGFFDANSAHPFENPTPLSNVLEVVSILVIPVALTRAFGRIVKDERQGLALLAAMVVLFVPAVAALVAAEGHGNPLLEQLGAVGPNLEGKELRFGVGQSSVFAAATTAASCGAVNGMHESFSALGGLVPLWLILLGEVVFGGVGAGLYGMLMFAIVAVFVAGLMVGRTPEYVTKKIESFEMKMASIAILAPPMAVLFGTALAVSIAAGTSSIWNPGRHGFTEVLYAYASAANNNGSAFAGISANVPFYNLTLAAAMLVGRVGCAIPAIAIAGAVAQKRPVAQSVGTLPTHGPLFVVLLCGTVLLVGALTFLPALALGPIVEHFSQVTP